MTERVPIDAVYLWIDDRQPATRSMMEQLGIAPGQRFRDNGELRYSLRSLERYAPWVRNVHLVTPGLAPDWLREDHPRVRIVPHAAIFPDPSALPSFNSNAIETNLHRIPGLSEEFLYFNDDLFFGAAVSPADYLTPSGGQVFFLDDPLLHADPDAGSAHDRSYAATARRVDRSRGPAPLRRLPAHCPQLYRRTFLARLEARFAEDYERTRRNRVRSPDDWVFRVAYMIDLLEGPDCRRHRAVHVRWRPGGYWVTNLRPSPIVTARALRILTRIDPSVFCVNDEMGRRGRWLSGWQLRFFLRRRFPRPSSFERPS